MTYQEANETLQGRCRNRRKVCNNTYLVRQASAIAIRFYNTNILTFYSDGTIRFNTDGYRTVTTKAHMNEYGPSNVRIYQDRGIWYIQSRDMPPYKFFDGVIVNPQKRTISRDYAKRDCPKIEERDSELDINVEAAIKPKVIKCSPE